MAKRLHNFGILRPQVLVTLIEGRQALLAADDVQLVLDLWVLQDLKQPSTGVLYNFHHITHVV